MTDKLEELLATEFRSGSYDLSVDAARLTATLRRRRARRTTATVAGAGMALAATIGVGVGYLGGLAAAPTRPADPVATSSATAAARRLTAGSLQIGGAVVRGLPADAKLSPDPGAALAQPPVVELPQTGERAVITVPSAAATPIRLVIVVNVKQQVGLPGFVDNDQPWLRSLGGALTQLTVDDANETTYLNAATPAGRRWALAATGPDAAARLDLIRKVATATVPGS